jgi:hypothetical protein
MARIRSFSSEGPIAEKNVFFCALQPFDSQAIVFFLV